MALRSGAVSSLLAPHVEWSAPQPASGRVRVMRIGSYWVAFVSVLATVAVGGAGLRLGLLDFAIRPGGNPGSQAPVVAGEPSAAFQSPLPILADALALPSERDFAAEKRFVGRALPFVRNQAQDGHREYVQQWFGVPLLQYPNDMLTYQAMIWAQRPDVIIETGTYRGGLTLYLAMCLQAANPKGRVITVDVDRKGWDKVSARRDGLVRLKNRITFIHGSSTDPETLEQIKTLIPPSSKVLVLLDSLHSKQHVLDELELYGPLVTPSSYIVVTDTHLDGTHWVGRADGALAAVNEFVAGTDEFEIDRQVDRYFISANISGYLKRVK